MENFVNKQMDFAKRLLYPSYSVVNSVVNSVVYLYINNILIRRSRTRSENVKIKIIIIIIIPVLDRTDAPHRTDANVHCWDLSSHNFLNNFLNNLLQRTFTKFFNRHGLIVVKYGATLREMRFAIQA